MTHLEAVNEHKPEMNHLEDANEPRQGLILRESVNLLLCLSSRESQVKEGHLHSTAIIRA